jgi:catechol 2,3-dioxygenase-like lactoylglutathione lyase family enzyme
MSMKRVVPGIVVKDIDTAKDFYTKHLKAKIVFDAEWYVSLRIGGKEGPEISFATPHHDQDKPISPGTLSLYVEVDDVDAAYAGLPGIRAIADGPPTDKPWGDRSFMLSDPHGVRVYVFSPRAMSPEFAACVKEP